MIMHKITLVAATVLLLCGVTFARHENNPAMDWKALREKSLKMEFSVDRVDRTLEQCRKNNLTVQQADALLCPIYTAHAESLPTECIFLKIEEGLAKRIKTDQIRAAADKRLENIRKANRILTAARPVHGGAHQHLVMHSCMALESGLPEDVLKEILNRPGGFRYGRMIHVIEAGETLQLAGLAPQDIKHIMNDCLDRDLNRSEVFRVADHVLAEHRKGRDFKSIHDALWIRSD